MEITLIILLLIGWALAGFTIWIAYRFYRKCVVYDEVFQYLADDIYTNVKQFSKMSTNNLLFNEPEVRAAHNNMMIMAKRLEEILRRMEAATGLRLRPPPRPPPPKVV
jgi:hypothetical protein